LTACAISKKCEQQSLWRLSLVGKRRFDPTFNFPSGPAIVWPVFETDEGWYGAPRRHDEWFCSTRVLDAELLAGAARVYYAKG
jgi:hypothetical protein